jgi:hypothetical protein
MVVRMGIRDASMGRTRREMAQEISKVAVGMREGEGRRGGEAERVCKMRRMVEKIEGHDGRRIERRRHGITVHTRTHHLLFSFPHLLLINK